MRILGEQGQPLPAGEVGTIYMRDGFDFEYLDDPAKTAAARRDGYFTAGDQGHLDSDGYLFISDRRTDLILSGGFYCGQPGPLARALKSPMPCLRGKAPVPCLPGKTQTPRKRGVTSVQCRDIAPQDDARTGLQLTWPWQPSCRP